MNLLSALTLESVLSPGHCEKQRDSAKDGGFKAKMQALRPRKSPRPVSSQSQPPSGYDAKVLLRTLVLINGIK
jgi:hypothetical protein